MFVVFAIKLSILFLPLSFTSSTTITPPSIFFDTYNLNSTAHTFLQVEMKILQNWCQFYPISATMLKLNCCNLKVETFTYTFVTFSYSSFSVIVFTICCKKFCVGVVVSSSPDVYPSSSSL